MGRTGAAVLCAIVCLALPASARAADASVRLVEIPGPRGLGPYRYSAASFTARPGERNVVSVTSDGEAFVLHDGGADIAPGDRCSALDARTVRCEPFPRTQLRVERIALGDGADTVTGTAELADGGPGDDSLSGARVLIGGAGDDLLAGGDGNDTLAGGDGDDVLRGGGGDDGLRGDDRTAGADVLDGGEGFDTASWRRHEQPVTIDLADPAPDGAAGEGDTVAGVENANGGRGSDVLRGDDGPNVLDDGGPGDDLLIGRGGADDLRAGSGEDTVRGGTGDDLLDGGKGSDRLDGEAGDDVLDLLFNPLRSPDRLACGRGDDRVNEPEPTAFVPPDCEQVWLYSAGVSRYGRADGRSLLLELENLDATGDRWCALVELGSPRGSLGSTVLDMPTRHRGRRRVRIPLTPLGRRVAARPGVARVPLLLTRADGRCSRGRPRPDPLVRQEGYSLGL